MRSVKPEVRILGVDDAAFTFDDETTALIGTMFRGGNEIEGVIRRDITVDGFDVTDTVLDMVTESRHRDQIQVVILDGITFAGFNIVDIHEIAETADVGVIAVSRNQPDLDRIRNGLEHVDRPKKRLEIIKNTGDAREHHSDNGVIYFQHSGISEEQTHEVLEVSRRRGLIPEPVRVSHMIAGALKNGESKGRV